MSTGKPAPPVSGTATVNADKPWPGLLAFGESDEHYFQGRRTETEALFRIVMRERLVVLFGLSGLGKSSLLQAGLFPLLRPRNVLPAYIRLDFSEGALHPVEQVKAAVAHEALLHHIEAPRIVNGESLWEFFHRGGNSFWNPRNRPMMPLLVFDQYEEIFTLGRLDSVRAQATESFVDQLADIAEGRPPAALKAWIDEHPDEAGAFDFNRHHYKILLSIREDFLPDLESLRPRMPALALNRLRLRRMNGEAALEVVSQAEHLIGREVARQVVRFVAADRHNLPLARLEVEPALLSVVCRELNSKRLNQREARITAGLLEGSQEQVLTDFYERSTADLPIEVRLFIEDHLLTVSGYRDSVALENALSVPGMSRQSVDELVEKRLVRREDRGGVQRLELTHDLLAGVVRESRESRRQKEEAEKERLALLRSQQEQQRALLAAKEEERLELERAQEKEKRNRERRELKRSRIAAGVFLFLTLLAVGAAVWAGIAQRQARRLQSTALEAARTADQLRKEAERQKRLAEGEKTLADVARQEAAAEAVVSSSRELATAALLNLPSDPEVSVLLALAARDRFVTPEASDVLHRALQASRIRFHLPITLAPSDPFSNPTDRPETSVDETGSHVAILDTDGILTTWNLTGPSPRRSQRTVAEFSPAAAFARDGKTLAVASGAGIFLWDVAEQRVFAELKSEADSTSLYQKLAFSPTGKFLAVSRCAVAFRAGQGCTRAVLDLWNVAERKEVGHDLPSIRGDVHALAWSSDSLLAAGGGSRMARDEGRIAVWRNDNGLPPQPTLFTDSASGHINGLTFTPPVPPDKSPRLAYSGERSNDLQLLDSTFSRKVGTWTGHSGGLRSVAASNDGALLATASSDHTARIWDAKTNQELFPLIGHKDEVRGVAFSGDGKRLVTIGLDNAAKVWSLTPNGELRSWVEPPGGRLLSLSGDGRQMITARPAGGFAVDLVSGSAHRIADRASMAALSGDGRLLAYATFATIRIEDQGKRQKLPSVQIAGDFLFGLRFGGNSGRLLMICEREPRLREVTAARDLKLPAGALTALATGGISPNGQLIVLRTEMSDVTVWNLATGVGSKMTSKAGDGVELVFSPDGKLLAGSAPDGNIVIWNAGSGRVVRNFSGHSGSVTALAFSADSKLLASGGADKITRIWDLATGEEQLSLGGHTDSIKSIAFSADPQRLTTVTARGEALVYALNPVELAALARTRVTRAMTPGECRKFLHADACPIYPPAMAQTARKREH